MDGLALASILSNPAQKGKAVTLSWEWKARKLEIRLPTSLELTEESSLSVWLHGFVASLHGSHWVKRDGRGLLTVTLEGTLGHFTKENGGGVTSYRSWFAMYNILPCKIWLKLLDPCQIDQREPRGCSSQELYDSDQTPWASSWWYYFVCMDFSSSSLRKVDI